MDIPVWLDQNDCRFPDSRLALRQPNGLLAAGGSLDPDTLLDAYHQGIFPWYSEDQPLLWWSPDPRAVLFPEHLRISRSLRKTIRSGRFNVSADRAFDRIIDACAAPRRDDDSGGTWITAAIRSAYTHLHQLGYAHSIEVWENGELAGGLYGVALGRVFFGESMFHHQRDASKVALVHLVQHLQAQGFRLIDCQQATPHLESLGATTIPRQQFNELLQRYTHDGQFKSHWQLTATSP